MRDYTTNLGLSWISTYQSSDQLWLIDSLNWEKTANIATADWSIISFVFNSNFISNHFTSDSITKLSYLDTVLVGNDSTFSVPQRLYTSTTNDILLHINSTYLPLNSMFQSEFQDLSIMTAASTPEVLLILNDFKKMYILPATMSSSPSAITDSYLNNMNFFVPEGVVNLTLFFFYIWVLVYFSAVSVLLKWTLPFGTHFARHYYYFFSLTKETRMQFEATLQTIVFIGLYWAMVIMAFDDDQEEFIEFVDSGFFVFFTVLVLFLVFKYSIHYFAFLEASVAEGRTVKFAAGQFSKDFLNTFSLLLRFYILLFRINVYDSLDDFFDSYYIFVGDFDDDEYLNELFLSIHGTIFFTLDNNDDRSFLLEDENGFANDFFYTYFVVWGKLMFFLFFTVEEIARLGLAFYICYLIIFEVHSVNCSYKEDNYLSLKRL